MIDVRPPSARSELDQALQARIERGAVLPTDPAGQEAEFNRLALELFAFQYEHNLPYRRFCRARRAEPDRLTDWTQIPPVPLTAFKELVLACDRPEQAAAVFMTSGSTDAERRGRNHHPHLDLYDASLRVNFAHHVLPDRQRIRMLVLNPRAQEQPHSSIAYFFGRLVDFFGTPASDVFLDDQGLQWERLVEVLREAEAGSEPVALLGTSFAYVHLLDALAREGVHVRLPAGSRVLDTGGFKGRSREVSADELRGLLDAHLDISPGWYANYYGMTEISTQYYDTTVRSAVLGVPDPGGKSVPAWARIRVVDPETGADVPAGERGLLVHYDLANRGSCLAVLSEDVGSVLRPQAASPSAQTFALLGRAAGSAARGCSLALDEFLDAAGPGRR